MKTWLISGFLMLSMASPVFAHCGSCGVGDDAEASVKEKAHGQCALHVDKNATLIQAAAELADSNPELSTKLKDMAAHCCEGH